MINYELAKKLKEAGFPQNNSEFYYSPYILINSEMKEPEFVLHYKLSPLHSDYCGTKGSISCPTLSELIEACGGGFQKLEKVETWSAYWCPKDDDGSGLKIESGKTPEEAVANLWLELNGKK